MRKLKKLLAVASVAAMTLSLCACGGKKDDTYTVGICQLVQHEALDAATKGFKDALVEEFGEDGIKFDEQNAQGDANTCATIINLKTDNLISHKKNNNIFSYSTC